ncbi:MAG: metallophosphoesterase [Coriobacteriia bacterium]|nr:metallophosphoesterase [Coriobacteriia bacterium]
MSRLRTRHCARRAPFRAPRAALALVLAATLAFGLGACAGAAGRAGGSGASETPATSATTSTATPGQPSSALIGQRLSFGAPTEGSDSLVFLGDTQDSGPDGVVFGPLLSGITSRDLIVIAGDLVNDQDNKQQWQAFAGQFPANVAPDKQVAVVPGNHTPDPPALNLFAKQTPALVSLAHTEVVLLDSNLLGSLDEDQIRSTQQFLTQALARRAGRNLIFVMHHPLFPLTNDPKNATRARSMMKNYGSYFKQATLILCGHEHSYARYTDPATGITQVMGNASAKVYTPVDTHRPGLAALVEAGPVITRLSSDSASVTLKTFDISGNLIDSCVIPSAH